MKARIKGTNDPFQEITGIEINYTIYDPEVIEFENNFIPNNTIAEDEHWQDVRERAAIAAMQGMLANPELLDKISLDYRITIERAAIGYANELIEQLKKK